MCVERNKEVNMGKIEGVQIKNFGPLRDIVMGKTLNYQQGDSLGNVTAIIGPSGNGKSTLADAFGFLADCLEMGVEEACDTKNRGGFQQIRSQGVEEPVKFESKGVGHNENYHQRKKYWRDRGIKSRGQ